MFLFSRVFTISGVPRIFFGRGCSTNSVEDRGQREWGSESRSPLVRGSNQLAKYSNPYSDYVVTDVFSTELVIWLLFLKTWEFRPPPPPVRHCSALIPFIGPLRTSWTTVISERRFTADIW
jgi:hypothetical protein